VKLQAIGETGFHYRDKSPPMNYVVNISSNMQVFYTLIVHFILITASSPVLLHYLCQCMCFFLRMLLARVYFRWP
jgi:hypothetical protein